MTNNNRNPLEETNFPNDRLTDLVLHKDDESIILNDEFMNDNEPEGENDGDTCWFPIHFSYRCIDHTADVQRTQTPLAEYHVSGVTPAMEHLPDPFVIAEHFSKEKFDFPVNETYYPLEFGNTIIRAISQENNNGLSLSGKEGSGSTA